MKVNAVNFVFIALKDVGFTTSHFGIRGIKVTKIYIN
jgi:hypothetical protein